MSFISIRKEPISIIVIIIIITGSIIGSYLKLFELSYSLRLFLFSLIILGTLFQFKLFHGVIIYSLLFQSFIITNPFFPTTSSLYFLIFIFILFIHYFKGQRVLSLEKSLYFFAIYVVLISIAGNSFELVLNIITTILFWNLVNTRKTIYYFEWAVILAAVIISLITLYFYSFTNINLAFLGKFGINDRNYLSSLLSFGAVLAFIKMNAGIRINIFYFILFGLIVLAQVLLLSRGGLFSTIAAVLFLVIFYGNLKKNILSILFIGLLGFYLYYSILAEGILNRINDSSFNTFDGRTDIWYKSLTNFLDQDIISILFGGGYLHFLGLSNGASLHNNFLEVCVDFGIFGLLLFGYMIFMGFKNGDMKQKGILFCFCIISLSLTPYMYLGYCLILGYGLVKKVNG